MLDQIQPHIRKIEKLIDETSLEAENLQQAMKSQLQSSKEKILSQLRNSTNPKILSPFASKVLKSWRDPSISYQPSMSENIFTLKRKPLCSSTGIKKFKASAKVSDASTIVDEQADFESDSENEEFKINYKVPGWAKDVMSHWKEVNAKHDPEAIFAPIRTPQGSGILCDLKEIFPQSKRAYEQRGDSGNWHYKKS